jgi:hypothetical protein
MAKRGPFIEPTRSTASVPPALQQMRVAKQGDGDYACGLFALVTAAWKLRTTAAQAGASTLLSGLAPADRARVAARLPKIGLFEKDLRALANAAGLAMYRPNTHDLAQFCEPGWLWMALVLVRFTSPNGEESCVYKHYVLVVEHLPGDGAFVVADPHPWNPSMYCVDEREFEAAWRAPRRPRVHPGPPLSIQLRGMHNLTPDCRFIPPPCPLGAACAHRQRHPSSNGERSPAVSNRDPATDEQRGRILRRASCTCGDEAPESSTVLRNGTMLSGELLGAADRIRSQTVA